MPHHSVKCGPTIALQTPIFMEQFLRVIEEMPDGFRWFLEGNKTKIHEPHLVTEFILKN